VAEVSVWSGRPIETYVRHSPVSRRPLGAIFAALRRWGADIKSRKSPAKGSGWSDVPGRLSQHAEDQRDVGVSHKSDVVEGHIELDGTRCWGDSLTDLPHQASRVLTR
jgi:hypothetical protein